MKTSKKFDGYSESAHNRGSSHVQIAFSQKVVDAHPELALEGGLEEFGGIKRKKYIPNDYIEPERDKLPDRIPNKSDLLGQVELLLSQAFDLAKDLPQSDRDDLSKQCQQRLSVKALLPDPDYTGDSYDLYVKGSDPVNHLLEVWQDYLGILDDNKNYLTSSDLQELDPKLHKKLVNDIHSALKKKQPLKATIKNEEIEITSINQLLPRKLSDDPRAVYTREYRSANL